MKTSSSLKGAASMHVYIYNQCVSMTAYVHANKCKLIHTCTVAAYELCIEHSVPRSVQTAGETNVSVFR